MADKNTISSVFHDGNRRTSIALLDTAEGLVESLDSLSVCLRHIEEKYDKDVSKDKDSGLFKRLKENLDSAQELTDTLKREKWRMSRRELSVELRMDELQEYKSHMKRDMSDMNQTVDVLSIRVVQLENALCEGQEIQETLQHERDDFEQRMKDAEKKCEELDTERQALLTEVKGLRLQRSTSMLLKKNEELSNEREVLQLENRRLKEMIREAEANTLEAQSEARAKQPDTQNTQPKSLDRQRNASDSQIPTQETQLQATLSRLSRSSSAEAANGDARSSVDFTKIAYV